MNFYRYTPETTDQSELELQPASAVSDQSEAETLKWRA